MWNFDLIWGENSSPARQMTRRIRLCAHGLRVSEHELWTKRTSIPPRRPPWRVSYLRIYVRRLVLWLWGPSFLIACLRASVGWLLCMSGWIMGSSLMLREAQANSERRCAHVSRYRNPQSVTTRWDSCNYSSLCASKSRTISPLGFGRRVVTEHQTFLLCSFPFTCLFSRLWNYTQF